MIDNALWKRTQVISTEAMHSIAKWRNLSKTDFSARLWLARNDNVPCFLQSVLLNGYRPVGIDFNTISSSPDETIEFGRKIGSQLKGGEIIAVCGPLGSGKTHLIKGIAAGAGAQDQKHVTSPTFVIVNEYVGRLDIYHVDAYRLNSIGEFEMLGFDDFCYPQSVVLIEWADKVESALQSIDYIRIELSHAGQTERRIHVGNAPEYLHHWPDHD